MIHTLAETPLFLETLSKNLPEWVPEWARAGWILSIALSLILIIVGLPIIRLITSRVSKVSARRLNVQSGMLITKAVKYSLYILLILFLLSLFGVTPTAILGAAGVAGVAIGFASQTSLSNIISGLFLIGERPFEVGDVIEIDGTTGIVDAINLLSCSLRTLDNKMVRIPNENLIKSQVTNITRHPIRRVNLEIGVSYNENIDQVMAIMREIAKDHPLALAEPEPLIIFKGFGASSLDFMLGIWAEKTDFLKVKNGILQQLKERFDEEGIEIPFPHMTIAGGKASTKQ